MEHLPAASPRVGSRALIVDHDDDTRRMYAEYLRFSGWRIDEAADGREALAKALAAPPDAIVSETRLPGINGYDLCALLRRDAATRRVPIVVVTADAYAGDETRARGCGADTVLVKPCLPEDLASELQRVVTARQRDNTVPATAKRAALRASLIPRQPPATVICPRCQRPLAFDRSHVGGVDIRRPEQWDYFTCPGGCGTFQYRVRTRRLRKVL